MARRISTGLANFLMGEGSFRHAFEDGILEIWTGTEPTYADDAPTGVKLCVVTKSSGAVATTDRSTPQLGKAVIPNHTSGNTFKVNVTVDGVGPTAYTFTNTPDAGSVAEVARLVAQMLNDIPQLQATYDGVDTVYVQHRMAGEAFTIADGGGTSTLVVTNSVKAASKGNTLRFDVPAAGISQKVAADTWSGVNLASGVAGYFRFVQPADGHGSSQTDIRAQGAISTGGAELNLDNPTLNQGATLTIGNYEFQLPFTE